LRERDGVRGNSAELGNSKGLPLHLNGIRIGRKPPLNFKQKSPYRGFFDELDNLVL
jgi:hypothetical protein